jgi:hypothetical protein
MENNSYHVPFYVVNNGVATSGHSADLAAAKVGIFDRQNFSVATSGGSGVEFYFAQGQIGGKDWYGLPVASSHKSPFFMGTDVEAIYTSDPVTIQNEEWILGYNGSPTCKGLKFEKGEATRVKFYFHGEPTYRFFNGPKEYVVSHTPTEDCTTPCESGDCSDAISDPIVEAKKLVDKINNHTELRKFGVQAYLTFAAATDEGSGTVTATRTMRITLNRNADGSDRLAEFADWIGAVDGVDISSLAKVVGAGTTTDGQTDDYTVEQESYEIPATAAALSNNVTFQYAQLPAIENVAWVFVSETDPADVAAATPVADRKVGIRVTAGYVDKKFGDCSFQPTDYYNSEPVKMEVSLLQEDGDRCDAAQWPSVLQTKVGRIARQSGEWVVRESIMKTDAYLNHIKQFSLEPRMREAFDMQLLGQVDRNAYYKLYYITFTASYKRNFRKSNVGEKFTAVFAIKSTDTATITAFETNIIDVVEAKSGLTIHTNS